MIHHQTFGEVSAMTDYQFNPEIEVWKSISGFPGYDISDHGRVRSWRHKNGRRKNPKILKSSCNGKFYSAHFNINGIVFTKAVHHLVLITFLELPTNWSEAYFKDGNTQNVCVDNLEWGLPHKWKGGKSLYHNRYIGIYTPGHPRANSWHYVNEHIILAEKALGKPLPKGTHVHHHSATQLVICQDVAYHTLLHQRQKAYEACGHVSWRRCWICKKWDNTDKLTIRIDRKGHINATYHSDCSKKYMFQYHQEKRHPESTMRRAR